MKNVDYPVKKLSRKEFSDALQKGLGRAYLHATHYGIDEVVDLVLKACLSDQSWDAQAEPSKAAWLFDMFKNTRHLPQFKAAILAALKTKRDTWDVQLLLEVALQMAKAGDQESRAAIKEKALRKAKNASVDDWLGAEEYIEIAGLDGAIELARIYGLRLLKNPKDRVPQNEIFPNKTLERDFQSKLSDLAGEDTAMKAYDNYLKTSDDYGTTSPNFKIDREPASKPLSEYVRERYNLSSILEDANNKIDEYGVRYRQFGRFATKEELGTIYERLLKETDKDTIWRLLLAFTSAQLPRLDDELFLWAKSGDGRIREAAIEALAQNTDARVRALAREKMQDSKLAGGDSGSIALFVSNYETADAVLITGALHSAKRLGRNDAHSLAWDVIALSKKYHDIGLADTLRWSYEETPCSNCRHRIVEQLDSLSQFDGEILCECQFDSYEDTANLARKKLSE